MYQKVEICGVNTSKLKTLKNDEMMELLQRSKRGDQAARQRLVEGNLRMVLSVICGSVTVVAVCALTIIASFLPLPAAARLAVLALALVTAAAGIGGAAVLDAGAGWYQCPGCGALFVPTMAEYVKGYHTLTRRKLTCPECGRRGMCRRRVVR